MNDSILTSTKKLLGLAEDYTAFDLDVITHINSIFTVLNELGVGPENGFFIEDKSAKWSDYIGADHVINHVKTYLYLRVRVLFDPPTTGFTASAMKEQYQELEWRLLVAKDRPYEES